jgi:nucleotide-binding universal stress UspA family protein
MFALRKILVATDFSPTAAAALDHAAELAKQFEAEILLLHVLPILSFHVHFPVEVPLPGDWVESVRQRANADLAKEAARVKQVKVTTQLRDGQVPESVVSAVADFKADLVVIGTHGRRGLTHAMLGSFAERVVRHSPVPVLTVRAAKGT